MIRATPALARAEMLQWARQACFMSAETVAGRLGLPVTRAKWMVIAGALLGACGTSTERAATEACAEIAEARRQTATGRASARDALAEARMVGIDETMRVGHCAQAANSISRLGFYLRYAEGRLSGIASMVPGAAPSQVLSVRELGSADAARLGERLANLCHAGAGAAGLESVVAEIDALERTLAERADVVGCE